MTIWNLSKNNYGWFKLCARGKLPSSRDNHTVSTVKKWKRWFYFFFDGDGEDGKLNDCYRYEQKENKVNEIH